MGALIVIFCIIFAFLFYLGEKNDEIKIVYIYEKVSFNIKSIATH